MENPNFSFSAHTPIGLVAALQEFVTSFEKTVADFNKAVAEGTSHAAYFMAWHGTGMVRQATYAELAQRLLDSRDLTDAYWQRDLNEAWRDRNEDMPESIRLWMLKIASEAERSCRLKYMPNSSSDASNIVDLAKVSFWSNLYDVMSLEIKADLMNRQLEFRREEIAKAQAEREAATLAKIEADRLAEEQKKIARRERRAARKTASIYPEGTR